MSKALVKKPKTKQPKKLPLVKRMRNKIERLKLEELVLKSFVTESKTIAEVTEDCNAELARRNLGHIVVNTTNVKNYVEKIKDKITTVRQDFFEEAIRNAGVVDKVKHLSALIHSGYERRQAIRDDMMSAFESGDRDGFHKAVSNDMKNDGFIADTINKLAQIENKLQTCVTIEFVYSLAQRMTDVVMGYDGIQEMDRDNLIIRMSQVVDFNSGK